jgi:DNA primase
MSDNQELSDNLDFEYWLDRESIGYKRSRGRSGMQFQIQTCPNCGDGRYRTYMGEDTRRGNCFVCNETFNNIKFIHLYLGHDPESKRDWGRTYDYVRDVLKEQGWRPKRTTTAAVVMDSVELPESFELPTPDGRNLQYLEDRHITGELAKFFHLRCCVKGVWRFTNIDGTSGRQNFNNRVIIPVFDLEGKLVTFQGRDVTGLVGDKKYLFPSGLPGTGRYLFNGQNATSVERACMGEGAFDVIAIKTALDGEVALRDVVPIGSFGKHLSYGDPDGNDQLGAFIKLKASGLREVTIMWDGEPAALISALDAAKLLTGIGIIAKIALLPAEKDPNEVTTDVVRRAFWEATRYSPEIDILWRVKNPYFQRLATVRTDSHS